MKVESQTVKEACAQHAATKLEAALKGSTLVDRTADFPHFVDTELRIGSLLGTGGFGAVYEIKAFVISENNGTKDASTSSSEEAEDYLDTPQQQQSIAVESRKFLATHCLRNNSDSRYAVKILKPDVMNDAGIYIQAIMDVAVETRVLSDIVHPNIVKLRAVAKGSPLDGPTYFIIMDRLYDTLEKRIAVWAEKTKKWSTGYRKTFRASKAISKLNEIQEARIVAAFDLASAVQYLHDRQIVYRDLKSENVGFDVRDDIKLFDFGLVKELAGLKPNENGLYRLTGQTGSYAYMAPEVSRNEPYNKSCDTYSFAMLLWEMCSMKTPIELYMVRRLKEPALASPFKLPSVPDTWPDLIQHLLQTCWDKDPCRRPTMDAVAEILRTECVRLRGGDDAGLEHNSRRSTFVFEAKKAMTFMSVGDLGPLDHPRSVAVAVP